VQRLREIGGRLVIDPALTAADVAGLAADLSDGGLRPRLGFASGHAAVFLPQTGVLLAGDMLSDVEIPLPDLLAADPLGDYRAGLDRLAAVPGAAGWFPATVISQPPRSSGAVWIPTIATWTC
jgi:hypothetical protein